MIVWMNAVKSMSRSSTVLLLLSVLMTVPAITWAEQATVAVASNFSLTAKRLVHDFQRRSGHRLVLISGASGKLFAQISQGAPFDLFLSADQAKPQRLTEMGWAAPDSRFTYAMGRLALWSKSAAFVDATALRDQNYARLALANPRLAPYGAASLEVLRNLGLVEATRPKWVHGENVSQVFQFVFSGNADLGFVALSHLLEAEGVEGAWWAVPEDLHAPIKQDAILLKQARLNPAASGFHAYLQTEAAREVIQRSGFRTKVEKVL